MFRPGGLVGALLGYDSVSGARRFALPTGIATADGTAFFSARAAGGVTLLRRYSPRTGRLENRLRIRGAWTLGAASANGRFVALSHPAQTEVYAANPTLGVVASVDLARLTVSSRWFARHPAGGWPPAPSAAAGLRSGSRAATRGSGPTTCPGDDCAACSRSPGA